MPRPELQSAWCAFICLSVCVPVVFMKEICLRSRVCVCACASMHTCVCARACVCVRGHVFPSSPIDNMCGAENSKVVGCEHFYLTAFLCGATSWAQAPRAAVNTHLAGRALSPPRVFGISSGGGDDGVSFWGKFGVIV